MHEIDRDHDEAVAIVSRLRDEGISQVSLFPLRIDSAIKECNVVIPMNGILGNFIFRALCYVERATVGGAFSLTRRLISIDTTRFGDAFAIPIQSAAAMVRIGGIPVEEYVPGKKYSAIRRTDS
jgi:predicted methyltransferase MtxX (methanogen marker protein 4)